MKRTAMILANRLRVVEGIDRSLALKRAWAMVKQGRFYTKVAGVTYGDRQAVIRKLKQYGANVYFEREADNEVDPNAVRVVAEMAGRRFKLGYLKREVARILSALMDKGVQVRARLKNVTGGYGDRFFGVNVSFQLVA